MTRKTQDACCATIKSEATRRSDTPNRLSLRIVMNAYTLIELLASVIVIGILVSLLMPAITAAKGKAKSARCVSNLRQLGIAVRLHTDDNEGRLPRARSFAQETNWTSRLPFIQEVLAPQVAGGHNVFRCSEDRKDNRKDKFEREGSSYEWNASLNGRLLHRIGEENRDASMTYLLRDRQGWHPRGRKNAVFVDGHVAEFSNR